MRIAVIGIGLPGSGKTTLLKPLAQEAGAVYICPDDIREELNGDSSDQSQMAEVWRITYRRIHVALQNSNVVVDATNAMQPDRLNLVAHCRKEARWIHGMWVTAPLSICLERNRNRERFVPEVSIGVMAGWLQALPPAQSEGFDELTKHSTYSPRIVAAR